MIDTFSVVVNNTPETELVYTDRTVIIKQGSEVITVYAADIVEVAEFFQSVLILRKLFPEK